MKFESRIKKKEVLIVTVDEPPQPVTGSERKLGLNSKSLISLAQAMVY